MGYRELSISGFACPIRILDIEISNDISTSQPWDYANSDICVVGLLYGDQISQFFREDDSKEYKKEVKNRLGNQTIIATPFYAFNISMEYEGMRNYFKGIFLDPSVNFTVKEIQPFKGKGWTKDGFFSIIKKNFNVTLPFKDPFENVVKPPIQDTWNKGERDKVLQHNVCCLLKEYWIWKYKSWFLKNYKVDDNGWIIT
jgi:hypothetical protein